MSGIVVHINIIHLQRRTAIHHHIHIVGIDDRTLNIADPCRIVHRMENARIVNIQHPADRHGVPRSAVIDRSAKLRGGNIIDRQIFQQDGAVSGKTDGSAGGRTFFPRQSFLEMITVDRQIPEYPVRFMCRGCIVGNRGIDRSALMDR